MSGERLLRIRFRAIGQETVTRAVRGITTSARQASQAQQRSDQQVTREAQRSSRSREQLAQREGRERQRAAAASARAIMQMDREIVRSNAAAARDEQRNANEVFRTRMRLRQQEAREQRQTQAAQRDARGRSAAVVGGGAIAAATAATYAALTGSLEAITRRLETITTAVGTRAGVQDVGQRTASAQDFEIGLARSSGEFFQGQDPEQMAASMHDLQTEIIGVANATAQSPTELLGVLTMMQSEFSQFEVGRRNLEAIANEAQRTGADMQDLARFVGVLNHQLGETAPTAEHAFDIMSEQGLQGALTPQQLATDFGGLMGNFVSLTGLQGDDALRQFGALANSTKSNDISSSEAATQMQGFMTALGDTETRQRLQIATGGHYVGHGASRHVEGGTAGLRADGTVDLPTLINDMSQVQGIGMSDVVFGRTEARLAAGRLVSLHNQTAGLGQEGHVATFDELAGASAEHGHQLRSNNLQTVMGTSAIESRRIAVMGEGEGIDQRAPRVDQANAQLAFQEAITQSNNEGLVATTANLPFIGDFLAQNVLPQLAQAATHIAPETRDTIHDWGNGHIMQTMPGLGLLGAAAGSVQQLGDVGDRAAKIQALSRVSIEPGSRVEIGDQSIDRFVRGVVSAMPAGGASSPPAGPPATSRADLRVPRGRRS